MLRIIITLALAGGVLVHAPSFAWADAKKMMRQWSQDESTRWLLLSLEKGQCDGCAEKHQALATLRNRFGKEGLRVAVVQGASSEGTCTPLAWKPDFYKCDSDGGFIRGLGGISKDASWLLWSWHGGLIGSGENYADVAALVQAQTKLKTTVVIEARDPKHKKDPKLRRSFRKLLDKSPRFEIIDEASSDRLQAEIQQKWLSGFMDGKKACEFRTDKISTYVLRAKLEGLRRKKRISLRLLSGEVSCTLSSFQLKVDLKKSEKSYAKALQEVWNKLYSAADLIKRREAMANTESLANQSALSPQVKITGGSFLFGCRPGSKRHCGRDESPVRRVSLDDFEIDRTEVTVARYRDCVKAGKCDVPFAFTPGCNWGKEDKDSHPVNCVTWQQASTYCAFRGQRLPTEAEWERAACGAKDSDFPWGNAEPTCDLANHNDGGKSCGRGSTTAAVGVTSAGANAEGVLDLAGNVAEWVYDWYGPYDPSDEKNPRGPKKGEMKVYRGGGYFDHPLGLRCTRRAR